LFVKGKLQKAMSPFAIAKWNYFQDNNRNFSNQYTAQIGIPLGFQHNFLAEYQSLYIGNKNDSTTTQMNNLAATLQTRPRLGWQLSATLQHSTIADTDNPFWLYKITTAHRIEGGHFIEFSHSKERFYYTAQLLQQNIATRSNTLIYNGKVKNLIGIYTHLQRSNFSDDNQKNSLYAAVYHNFSTRNLKVGAAVLYLDFALQVPVLYYSPEQLRSAEVFVEYNNFLIEEKKWEYRLELATGLLQEKEQPQQVTYRLTGYLSHHFGFQNHVYLRVTYGNSSQAQLNLYSVGLAELGVKVALWRKKL
jgi:hypothetical protein